METTETGVLYINFKLIYADPFQSITVCLMSNGIYIYEAYGADR